MMDTEKLQYLIRRLLDERPEKSAYPLPDAPAELFRIYRSLVNIRPAGLPDAEYLETEEAFLREYTAEKGITTIGDLSPAEDGIYLWRGDITTLACDAIVNAANSGMTGCWSPCHSCIDNAIHTFAGVQLRYACDQLMRAQGHEEPTGSAKLTEAYALPCKYILHTVGPIVDRALNDVHKRLLESCYQSCLTLASENGIRSIAFCCISTGVFGFPQQEAAEIAVRTIREFRETHDIKIIFNVFKEDDEMIYRRLLG